MTFDGQQMHSAFAGSNDKASFMLIAYDACKHEAHRLCTVYHTTNAVTNTFSGKIVIPESRILAKGSEYILKYLDDAIAKFSTALRTQRGLYDKEYTEAKTKQIPSKYQANTKRNITSTK